jgi:hypothetical protein
LVFGAAALPGLKSYGSTWDLAVGEYGYGHQFLAYACSLDEEWLDFAPGGRMPPARQPHPDFTWQRLNPAMVTHLGAMLSAASCELFWTRLGWLPAMEAHNLVVLAFFAALLGTLTYLAGRLVGPLGAVVAVLAALGMPRLVAHGFNNLKDLPTTVLYLWTWLATVAAFTSGRKRGWLLVGVLLGLSLAQKANAVFIPVSAGLWWLVMAVGARRHSEARIRFPWLGVAIVAVGAERRRRHLARPALCRSDHAVAADDPGAGGHGRGPNATGYALDAAHRAGRAPGPHDAPHSPPRRRAPLPRVRAVPVPVGGRGLRDPLVVAS